MVLNERVRRPYGGVVSQSNATPVRSFSGNAGATKPPSLSTGLSTGIDKMAVTVTIDEIEMKNALAKMQKVPTDGPQNQRLAWPSPITFATPRGYHIPRVKYEAAARLAPPNPSAYWRYDMFEGPGGHKEKVTLHYCKNREDMEKAAQLFLKEKVIGFDMEWKMYGAKGDIKQNVSLIQFASESHIALFHLAQFPNATKREDFVTPSLEKLMASPEITKVGVNIKGDTGRLLKFLNIKSRGSFELSNLHKLVMHCTGKLDKTDKLDRKLVSLEKQAKEHFCLPIWKDTYTRCSDWTRYLSQEQTQYAATDPYVNILLFYIMEAKRLALNPVPPRPAHAELNQAILLHEPEELIEICRDEFECRCSKRSDMKVREPAGNSTCTSAVHTSDCAQTQESPADNSDPSTPDLKGSTSSQPTPRAKKSTSKSPSRGKAIDPVYAAQLERANKFVEEHRDPSNKYLTAQSLRVYSLWHEQAIDVTAIASMFRNPPILKTTVVKNLYDALANLPEKLHCSPQKIVEVTTRTGFSPYVYKHKMVLSRATFKLRQAGTADGSQTNFLSMISAELQGSS